MRKFKEAWGISRLPPFRSGVPDVVVQYKMRYSVAVNDFTETGIVVCVWNDHAFASRVERKFPRIIVHDNSILGKKFVNFPIDLKIGVVVLVDMHVVVRLIRYVI